MLFMLRLSLSLHHSRVINFLLTATAYNFLLTQHSFHQLCATISQFYASTHNTLALFQIEHIANIATHGFWILPAIYASILLLFRSNCQEQILVALIYGSALILLFLISTLFHCVFYVHKNILLKDLLHRMDRAMICKYSFFWFIELNSAIRKIQSHITLQTYSSRVLTFLGSHSTRLLARKNTHFKLSQRSNGQYGFLQCWEFCINRWELSNFFTWSIF